MSILNQWLALPFNVQRKLSVEFNIKSHGTNEAQLIFELQTKLPQGLLKEEVEVKAEKVEKPTKPAKEVKEVKAKKTKKSK